jgi:serine phosphatase RsbU (regulator of sigma subunit)
MSTQTHTKPAGRSQGNIPIVVIDGDRPLPPVLEALVSRHGLVMHHVPSCEAACHNDLLDRAGVVFVANQDSAPHAEDGIRTLLDRVNELRTGVIFLDDRNGIPVRKRSPFTRLSPSTTSVDELWGRVCTMMDYQSLLQRVDRELRNMERMGRRLNHHFNELDQEMRLASRLQHDFLPQHLPAVGKARFATLYRPASWVSGDIYDVFRLDESRVGFYVGDAVGHGVAAGLLTVFIKRSIWTKNVYGRDYDIITPGQTLAALNDSLLAQHLPNSQFVTACYCLLDTATLDLSFARGGHPYPLHVSSDGTLNELTTSGGLLGLFADETFPERTIRLAPGDKVVLYSDGVEILFNEEANGHGGDARFRDALRRHARLSAQELIERLTETLDSEAGSLNPGDDLTVIVLEICE